MALALTIFIALVIVVLGVIGYVRDPRRSLLALLGTLFGALLVEFWGAQWGAALSARFSGDPQRATFIVNCLVFLWGALIVGYGGAVLLGRSKERPAVPQRLASALLGALNGVLIVGFLLRYAAIQQPGFAALVQADPVARVIHAGMPLLFLGLAAAVTLLVIVRGIVRLFSRRPGPPPPPTSAPSQPSPSGASGGPGQRVDDSSVLNKINHTFREG
jgi:hypothetical protein